MDSLRSPRDQRFTIAYILNPPGHAPLLPPFRMLVPLLSRNAVATSNLARRRQQRAIRSQQEVRYPDRAMNKTRLLKLMYLAPGLNSIDTGRQITPD